MFGGKSVEHEVSVISGIQAIMSMDQEKYEVIPVYLTKKNEMYVGEEIGKIEAYKDIPGLLSKSQRVILVNEDDHIVLMPYPVKLFGKKSIEVDIAFPIVHGTNVEDGALQGYLKTIVKPVDLGSSVGISVARNRSELTSSIDDAFLYARKIIIEHAITKLREINCAVLGDENEAIASECEEPLHTKDILSYEDKYVSNAKGSGSKGMASVSRKIPAELSPEKRKEVQELAVKSFQKLGCNGVARIDFMIDEENGKLYFNEINTIPGSLAFYLWEPVGISYPELLDRMIRLALKRVREEESITFSFDTNILNQNSLGGVKGGKMGKLKAPLQ